MNEQQHRALWGAALRALGESIAAGLAPIPTSVNIWTQYVTPLELMGMADFSTPQPIKIDQFETHADVTIPTGQPLDMPIQWTMSALTATDPDQAAKDTENYVWHNLNCTVDD